MPHWKHSGRGLLPTVPVVRGFARAICPDDTSVQARIVELIGKYRHYHGHSVTGDPTGELTNNFRAAQTELMGLGIDIEVFLQGENNPVVVKL